MFKKLKDKIAEEVKQSPLKSVQQLASAVVSPSSSSVFEPSSNDHFCIDDDDNQETPKNSPAKTGGFTTVNLQGQASSPLAQDTSSSQEQTRSRRSSASSVASDASTFFPRYEPSSVHFHLQSDLESASEVEDAHNVQLERVSKENLFDAYRKLRMRYNKYKGRFVDLAEHYRRLEKENIKCKNILTETQDKAFRRISELREQCVLEQEAKAHLEEALRSDLEEKDHLINTLNTKVELLKKGGDEEAESASVIQPHTSANGSLEELNALKEKVKSLDGLLGKCRTVIIEKNQLLENQQKELTSVEDKHSEKVSLLMAELNSARGKIEDLKKTVETLKKNEEEAALTLAENKLTVHRELETRDELLKMYKINIEEVTKEKEELSNKVTHLQSEVNALNGAERNRTNEDDRADLLEELSRGKSEAVKLMQQKLSAIEQSLTEKLNFKENELDQISKENDLLKQKVIDFEEKLASVEGNMVSSKADDEDNRNNVNRVNEIESLKQQVREHGINLQEVRLQKEQLENSIADKEKEIDNLIKEKKIFTDKGIIEINILNGRLDEYKEKLEKLQELYKTALDKNSTLENDISVQKENNEKEIKTNVMLKMKCNDTILELENLKTLCSSKDEELVQLLHVKDLLNKTQKDLNERINIENQLNKELIFAQNQCIGMKILSENKISELNGEICHLQMQRDGFLSEIHEKDECIKSINEKLQDLEKEKLSLEKKLSLDDINNVKLIETLKKDKATAENNFKDAENKIVSLKNEIKLREKLLNEKQSDLDNAIGVLKDHESKVRLHEEEIRDCNKKLSEYSEIDSKISSYGKIIFNAKAIVSNNSNKVADRPVENDINFTYNNCHNLQEEGEILLTQIKKLKDSLSGKQKSIDQLSKRLDEAQMKLAKLINERTSIEDIKNIHYALSSYTKSNLKEIENNLDSLKKQLKLVEVLSAEKEIELKNKFESKCRELDGYKGIINELKSNLGEKEIEMKDFSETKNKLSSLEEEKQLFESERQVLNEKISSLENNLSTMRNNCIQLKNKFQFENNKSLELETKLNNCLQQLNSNIKQNDLLEKEKCIWKESENELCSRLELSTKRNEELEGRIEEKEREMREFKNQISIADQNHTLQVNDEIASLKNKLHKMKQEEQEQINARHNLEENNKKLQEEIGSKCSIIELLEVKCRELEDKLNNDLLKLNSIVEEKDCYLNNVLNECDLTKKQVEELTLKHHKQIEDMELTFNQKLSDEVSKFSDESSLKIESLTLKLTAYEKKQLELESLLSDSLMKNERLKVECESLQHDKSQISEEVFLLKEQLKQISESKTDNIQAILELKSALESVQNDHDELKCKYEKGCEEVKRLQQELNKSRTNNELSRNQERQVELANLEMVKHELNDVKKENEVLRVQLKDVEENHTDSIKQVVLNFNTQLAEKDEEIKAAETKHFDRREAEDNFRYADLKQQIKYLQQELETRGDVYENLLEDHKEEKKKSEILFAELKKNHEKDIRDQDKKWRACLDRRLIEAENKYKEEIEGLTKEWMAERKELECSSRLAVAAMESGVGSSELLRKQVTSLTKQLEDTNYQYRREVTELQRMLTLKQHTKDKEEIVSVEDCTEMEYLRKILFEYMMGKEPLIMAKVLSAIVKFDPEQTNKILQKEEQKISLLGKVSSLIPKD